MRPHRRSMQQGAISSLFVESTSGGEDIKVARTSSTFRLKAAVAVGAQTSPLNTPVEACARRLFSGILLRSITPINWIRWIYGPGGDCCYAFGLKGLRPRRRRRRERLPHY